MPIQNIVQHYFFGIRAIRNLHGVSQALIAIRSSLAAHAMSKTVLIVDDSALVRKLISTKLKKSGYAVYEGSDGRIALDFLDGRDIDLLITDLNMPVMDGLNLIRYIRSTPHYQYLPIVLFVSDEIPDKKMFIKLSGATVGLDKKFVNEKLIMVVEKLIRR